MGKFAPARVSYRDDFLILYPVYKMTGSFHISLFEGTLHDSKIYVRFKIANITHALPVPVHRQTDFPPKRVVFVVCRILLHFVSAINDSQDSVGVKKSLKKVIIRAVGPVSRSPDNFSGPKSCFMFSVFAFKIKVSVILENG